MCVLRIGNPAVGLQKKYLDYSEVLDLAKQQQLRQYLKILKVTIEQKRQTTKLRGPRYLRKNGVKKTSKEVQKLELSKKDGTSL